MRIQKAVLKNLKGIGELMKTEFSKPPFNERDSIKSILESLEFYLKIGEIFVAEENKKIIGIIVVKFEQYWEGKVMIIEDLAVDSKFQNKWVGKELMKFAESYAKNKKAKLVLFKTHKKSKSVKFYKKLGYQQDKESIFMRKKLI